ncbi:hypothetical protein BDZ91DRAFT_848528 [Kalaharituber pfeilii]|nr:hypothetical protein BDZ91DRAFT_848528 [Kalaharituber pfeilii]
MTVKPSPASTAGLYPIYGITYLLTHPNLRTPEFYSLLLRNLLKTLLVTITITSISLVLLFHITDELLLTLAKSIAPLRFLVRAEKLRGVVAFIGILVQGAVLANALFERAIRGVARRAGEGVLRGKGVSDAVAGVADNDITASRRELEARDILGGLREGAMELRSGVEGVGKEVAGTAKGAVEGVREIPEKVEKGLKERGAEWAVKQLIFTSVTAVPIVGPVTYAAFKSFDLGERYIKDYSKIAGVEDQVDQNPRCLKAFGLVAGMLNALPVVGPAFYFSNYIGSALWVADMKDYKRKLAKGE